MGPKMGYQMVVNECPSSPSPGLPIIMPAAVVAANNSREEAAMAASVSEVGGIVSEGGGVDGEDQQPLQRMFLYTGIPRFTLLMSKKLLKQKQRKSRLIITRVK